MKRFYKVTVYNLTYRECQNGSICRRWVYFETYYFKTKKLAISSFSSFNKYNYHFKAVLRMTKGGKKREQK